MDRHLTAALLLLSVSVLPLSARAQEPAPPSPESVVDAFHAALARGDRETALGLLAEDVVIFEAGGAELSRQQYAHHHLASDVEFEAATRSTIVDRRRLGDDETAWVLTRSETSGTFRERDVATRGTETMILVRDGRSWRIVHIHWSSRSRGE